MDSVTLYPVGVVHSTRRGVADDDWDAEQSYIELKAERFAPDAFAGLQDFSHAEIIFLMHEVAAAKIETGARHPRNNAAWPKAGIFAQRAKSRPNRIGSTVCRILKVENMRLYLEGMDAIEGTPVLDIKPWVQEFGPRGSVYQPRWVSELMQLYWRK